jgi:hypothetical protein
MAVLPGAWNVAFTAVLAQGRMLLPAARMWAVSLWRQRSGALGCDTQAGVPRRVAKRAGGFLAAGVSPRVRVWTHTG